MYACWISADPRAAIVNVHRDTCSEMWFLTEGFKGFKEPFLNSFQKYIYLHLNIADSFGKATSWFTMPPFPSSSTFVPSLQVSFPPPINRCKSHSQPQIKEYLKLETLIDPKVFHYLITPFFSTLIFCKSSVHLLAQISFFPLVPTSSSHQEQGMGEKNRVCVRLVRKKHHGQVRKPHRTKGKL